jgi:hypothetical protein
MDIDQIRSYIRQYVGLKEQTDLLADRTKEIKDILTGAIDEQGETDARGHINLDIEDEVSGVKGIYKQRKVIQSLDMEVAEELLKSKGLWERCTEMKPVIKEDEIMAAYGDDTLTAEDIDKMFPKKVSYAFFVRK